MPANCGARRVLDQQHLLQARGVDVSECGSCFPYRQQEFRYVVGLLQAPAIELVSPSKRNDQALTGEALEFERPELQLFHFLNKPRLFGSTDDFALIAETLWKAQGSFEQLRVSLRHVLFAGMDCAL